MIKTNKKGLSKLMWFIIAAVAVAIITNLLGYWKF